jgi:hypothetical protein
MAIATAVATFTGAEDNTTATWTTPFGIAPLVLGATVTISDGLGPVVVDVPTASITTTGCTVETSGRFSGLVELVANGT